MPDRTGSPIAPPRWHGAALLVLAVGVRAVVLVGARGDPMFGIVRFDERLYRELARTLAERGWLAPGDPFFLSPLWTSILTGLAGIGAPDHLAVVLVQQALGVSAVLATWRLSLRFAPAPAALVASGVLAVLGPLLFYETTALADVLVMATAAWACLALVRATELRAPLATGVAFAAIGVAALARPTALALIPLAALGLALAANLQREKLAMHALSACAALALVIGPVTLRNWLASGECVLVSTSGAINLYIGNGAASDGTWRAPEGFRLDGSVLQLAEEATRVAEEDRGRELTRREVDGYWLGRTTSEIAGDPLRWLALLGRKCGHALRGEEIPDNRSWAFERQFMGALALPVFPSATWLIGPGVVGLALLFRRSRESWPVLLFGWVLPGLTLIGFFVVGRYRLVWLPALGVGFAYSLGRLVGLRAAWKAGGDFAARRCGATIAGAVLLLTLFSAWPGPERRFRHERFLRATALHEAGYPELAVPHYRQLTDSPALGAAALENLAVAYRQLGRIGDAVATYRQLESRLREAGDADGAERARTLADMVERARERER